MKIEIKKEVISYNSVVIDLHPLEGIRVSCSDPIFDVLIKAFVDETTWQTVGISCHRIFSDLPSRRQGGSNDRPIKFIEIINITKNFERVVLKIWWDDGSSAVAIMEQL